MEAEEIRLILEILDNAYYEDKSDPRNPVLRRPKESRDKIGEYLEKYKDRFEEDEKKSKEERDASPNFQIEGQFKYDYDVYENLKSWHEAKEKMEDKTYQQNIRRFYNQNRDCECLEGTGIQEQFPKIQANSGFKKILEGIENIFSEHHEITSGNSYSSLGGERTSGKIELS